MYAKVVIKIIFKKLSEIQEKTNKQLNELKKNNSGYEFNKEIEILKKNQIKIKSSIHQEKTQ